MLYQLSRRNSSYIDHCHCICNTEPSDLSPLFTHNTLIVYFGNFTRLPFHKLIRDATQRVALRHNCERSELSGLLKKCADFLYNCERSELPSLFNARIFYIFIYIFQAVRRAVNEMFETPDTVFNNLELLVNPSSTAKKCSATEDCCRNPGGDRHPSSTVKYCSATGLLPNRQRGERPGVNGLPFSHRRKETPVFNKLQLGRPKSHAVTQVKFASLARCSASV